MRYSLYENVLFKDFARESLLNGISIQFNNEKIDIYTKSIPITPFSVTINKIFAIPTLFWNVAVSIPLHLLQTIFQGFPAVCSGNSFYLKKHIFTLIRDIQGCIGKILILFNQKIGISFIRLSKNHKKYYNYLNSYQKNHFSCNSDFNTKTTQINNKNDSNKFKNPPYLTELEKKKPIAAKKIMLILKTNHDHQHLKNKITGSYSKDDVKKVLCKMLDLPLLSDEDVIKKSYKSTMLLIHPDKLLDINNIDEASQILNEVYDNFQKNDFEL